MLHLKYKPHQPQIIINHKIQFAAVFLHYAIDTSPVTAKLTIFNREHPSLPFTFFLNSRLYSTTKMTWSSCKSIWNYSSEWQSQRMARSIKELHRGSRTIVGLNIPRRFSACSRRREKNNQQYEETGIPAWHNDIITVEERCSSRNLQWRSLRHRLQSLVPSRTSRYLEWTLLCRVSHVNFPPTVSEQSLFVLSLVFSSSL